MAARFRVSLKGKENFLIGKKIMNNMVKCEKCGNDISKQATKCPKCNSATKLVRLENCKSCKAPLVFDQHVRGFLYGFSIDQSTCPKCGDPQPLFFFTSDVIKQRSRTLSYISLIFLAVSLLCWTFLFSFDTILGVFLGGIYSLMAILQVFFTVFSWVQYSLVAAKEVIKK